MSPPCVAAFPFLGGLVGFALLLAAVQRAHASMNQLQNRPLWVLNRSTETMHS